MQKIKIAVVAGFFGAGKTSCILELVKELTRRGKKVGIVTNNQGSQLVDTEFLRSEGLPVFEMKGGCFCRSFPEFVEKVEDISESQFPDIILAEPAGGCTGLIASILRPLKKTYAKRFELAPLFVVTDPGKVKKMMMQEEYFPFPEEIKELFRKQLEEADVILLNKADLVEKEELEEILGFLGKTFKGTNIFAISAKKGKGITRCLPFILGNVQPEMGVIHMDHGFYGKAEDRLGRFNDSYILYSPKELDFNSFALLFLGRLKKKLSARKSEIAHLKLYMTSGNDWAEASLAGLEEDIDFYRKMEAKAQRVRITVNACVNMETDNLELLIEQELAHLCTNWKVMVEGMGAGGVKSGRPVRRKGEGNGRKAWSGRKSYA